jgi:hypothetical protein
MREAPASSRRESNRFDQQGDLDHSGRKPSIANFHAERLTEQ